MEQRLSFVSAECAAAAMKKRRAHILVFSRVEEIALLIFTPLSKMRVMSLVLGIHKKISPMGCDSSDVISKKAHSLRSCRRLSDSSNLLQ